MAYGSAAHPYRHGITIGLVRPTPPARPHPEVVVRNARHKGIRVPQRAKVLAQEVLDHAEIPAAQPPAHAAFVQRMAVVVVS